MTPSPSISISATPSFRPSSQLSESVVFRTREAGLSANLPASSSLRETEGLSLSADLPATEPLIESAVPARSDSFSPRKETDSATPEPGQSEVGVIIGAVVGGVAVLGAIILAVVIAVHQRGGKSAHPSVGEGLNNEAEDASPL
jgi:hypothetical protein